MQAWPTAFVPFSTGLASQGSYVLLPRESTSHVVIHSSSLVTGMTASAMIECADRSLSSAGTIHFWLCSSSSPCKGWKSQHIDPDTRESVNGEWCRQHIPETRSQTTEPVNGMYLTSNSLVSRGCTVHLHGCTNIQCVLDNGV